MPTSLNNRYLLHESLGQGAMGIVYRATDQLSGEIVAIKRVTVPGENLQFASRSDAQTSEEIKLALAQEFRTLASLRHPHIISVLDYGFDDQRQPYFSMSYLPEAHSLIEASQGLDENHKVALLVQLLQALTYLHRRNILHRDLKPANVLVTDKGVRVLDFGLSISREQAHGRTGTLAYMAPETLQSGGASEASDLYAVGVMAYQLFAGELPFEPTDIMGILSHPAELHKLNASPELVAVISRLLQKKPTERYPDARETLTAFNQAIREPIPEEDAAIRDSFLQAARFVGRDIELAQLLAALDQAAQGQGSFWFVGSESGVGKTRLIKELRIRALVRGANVLSGQAIEGQGRSYQIWQEPLRRLALMGQLNDFQAGVLKPIVPDLEQLYGRKIPGIPDLDDKEAAQRLILTIGEVIKNGALATPPLVLLLEDLHWGLESLESLKAINRILAEIPLLVVGTYRTEEIPDLPKRIPGTQKMILPRFNPQAIAELSASMLGEPGLQPQVLNLLQNETEGNVFFLVETVRALAEEAGGLQSVGSGTLPQAVFAGGVQRIIQRRLEQVPESYRPMLKLAAVAGRALELEMLQTAYPEMDLETWLLTCANVAVLEIQDEHWRFAHDKLRENLLAGLEIQEKQRLHNLAAETIEATYANHLSPHFGRLAWHHSQAGNSHKECTYAKLAGEQAAAQYSHEEALDFFLQALNLTPKSNLTARYELLLDIRGIYKRQGSAEQQLENLEALQRLAVELGDPLKEAQINLIWAGYYYDRGNYPAAVETAQLALDAAIVNNENQIALKAYNLLASIQWKQNNLEIAETTAQTGLALARKIADQKNEADLLISLGMIAFNKRDLTRARTHFEQSLMIAEKNGYLHSQALAINNLGMVAGYQSNFTAAQNYYQQALKIFRESGARKQEAMNLTNLGWISGLLGEYAQAIGYTKDNIRIAREIGDLYNETYGLINLSFYTNATGDTREALETAEAAKELALQMGDRSAEAWALTSLGHCHFAVGEFPQAAESYQTALDIRETLKQSLLATEPAAGLARASLEQGDLGEALQNIQGILPVMEKKPGLEGTDDPLRVYLACYLVLKANQDNRANQILQTAHELIQSRAANIPEPQTRKSFLEGIPHHREILIAWQELNHQNELERTREAN